MDSVFVWTFSDIVRAAIIFLIVSFLLVLLILYAWFSVADKWNKKRKKRSAEPSETSECMTCEGKGGRFAKSVDIDGEYFPEWEECRTCGGSAKHAAGSKA